MRGVRSWGDRRHRHRDGRERRRAQAARGAPAGRGARCAHSADRPGGERAYPIHQPPDQRRRRAGGGPDSERSLGQALGVVRRTPATRASGGLERRGRHERQPGVSDGHRAWVYDSGSNTVFEGTLPAGHDGQDGAGSANEQPPSLAEIKKDIANLADHALLSGAEPTDLAGQPAYTVRLEPKRNGGLLGGAELAWDAVHGTPLRAAVYAKGDSSPVLELKVTDISYGSVPTSVFDISPPPGRRSPTSALPPAESPVRAMPSRSPASRRSSSKRGSRWPPRTPWAACPATRSG